MNSSLFVFDPNSSLWNISRELVLLLSGAWLAIFQIAYPEVACGAAAHSDFKRDAFGRLSRTLEAVYEIVFGTTEEVSRLAEHIRGLHAKVRGSHPRPYNAFSRDAQMWGLAALMVPAFEAYERFVGAIPLDWFPIYYKEIRRFGTFFSLSEEYGPQTWEDFRGYYDDMLHGDVLASDPLSAELTRCIIRPSGPLAFRLGMRSLRFLAEESLDSPVRERQGLRSRLSGRMALKAVDCALARLLPYLPIRADMFRNIRPHVTLFGIQADKSADGKIYIEFIANMKCIYVFMKFRHSFSRNFANTPRGFSLLELLVVIAIFALLSTLAVSGLSSKRGAEVSQAGGLVSDLANLARQNALSQNSRTALILAQITDGNTPRSAVSIWDLNNSKQLEKWNLLPESVVATNNSGYVFTATVPCSYRGGSLSGVDCYVFYPDGHMSEDPNQIAKLSVLPRYGTSSDSYTLVFNPLTGLFKSERP